MPKDKGPPKLLSAYSTSTECGRSYHIACKFGLPNGQDKTVSTSFLKNANPSLVASKLRLLADWVESLN